MTLSYLHTRILVNNKPIKIFNDYQGRKWIEARDDSIYEIEVKNSSSNRVLAVISIDGLNVITGENAEADPDNGGYVIEAYSTMKVKGWRTSDEEVKEFVFNFNKKESYSVKLGAGEDNIGAIGIAFFEEKLETKKIDWPPKRVDIHHHYHYPYPYTYYPYQYPYQYPYTYTTSGNWTVTTGNTTSTDFVYTSNSTEISANSTDSMTTYSSISSDASASDSVSVSISDFTGEFVAGTEKGEALESICHDTEFDNAIFIGTDTIYYDSLENLKKRGVILNTKTTKEMPKPFKATKYCPDI